MKYIKYFSDLGLDIDSTLDGNLKIHGLSSLKDDVKSKALEYAKKNKPLIVFELQTQNTTHQQKHDALWEKAWALADFLDDNFIPWPERKARIPEYDQMVSKIENLEKIIKQEIKNEV